MATEIKMVKCLNCKHATYKQWFQNPIIALCELKRSREVAEANRICKEFVERYNKPTIEHYDEYEE